MTRKRRRSRDSDETAVASKTAGRIRDSDEGGVLDEPG